MYTLKNQKMKVFLKLFFVKISQNISFKILQLKAWEAGAGWVRALWHVLKFFLSNPTSTLKKKL